MRGSGQSNRRHPAGGWDRVTGIFRPAEAQVQRLEGVGGSGGLGEHLERSQEIAGDRGRSQGNGARRGLRPRLGAGSDKGGCARSEALACIRTACAGCRAGGMLLGPEIRLWRLRARVAEGNRAELHREQKLP